MPKRHSDERDESITPDIEDRLEAIAREYLESLRRGETPDRGALLRAHPDIARELEDRLWLTDLLHEAASSGPAVEETRRLRCPHCAYGIELRSPAPEQVRCPSCGSGFRVEVDASITTEGAELPERIGKFRIDCVLGRGAFGVVYRAFDRELGRIVTLKVPRAGSFSSPEEEARFLREARSAALLAHPGIVRVHEIASERGVPYIVREFIDGGTLETVMRAGRPDFRESAALVAEVAQALEYAHAQGVTHRDVKPENILLDSSGRPYLTDFGLARRGEGEVTVTLDGQIIGTPAYMSPEQAAGDHDQVGPRSDVYSLGVVLYELLTGERPFSGNRSMVIHQVIHDEPRSPRRLNEHVPRDLETICLEAMAKEPDRRYRTAGELATDLRRFLAGEPVSARPVGRAERLWRWSRRNPTIAGLTVAVAALLVAATLVSAVMASRTTRAYDEARRRLSRLNIATGFRHADEGDFLGALAWFAEAYRLEEDQPDGAGMHRIRFESTLAQCPRLVRLWSFHDQVFSVEVASDGRHLLAVSGGRASILDPESGEALKLEEKGVTGASVHPSYYDQAAFAPDGSTVAAAGQDGAVQVWSVRGELLVTMHHRPAALNIAWSPDGRSVLTTGADRTARLWDAASGEPLLPPLEHSDAVGHAGFSPGGEWIATACLDGGVYIWRRNTGERIAKLDHAGRVHRLSFSRNGRLLATASADGTARIWETEAWRSLIVLRHGNEVLSVSFSPDGRRALTAGRNATALLWDASTGDRLLPPLEHLLGVHHACFSPNGSLVATGSYDGTARLWDAATGKPLAPLFFHGNAVGRVAFSPDGRRFATASSDRMVRLWDLAGREPHRLFLEAEGGLRHVIPAADGCSLVAVDGSGAAVVWDLEASRPRSLPLRSKEPIRWSQPGPDGNRLVTASGQAVQVWDVRTGEQLHDFAHPSVVTSAAFDPNGKLLVTAAQDGLARIWSVSDGRKLFELHAHRGPVNHVSFSPDGRWFVTGGSDGFSRIWDPLTGAPSEIPPLKQAVRDRFGVHHTRFSPDSRRVVTAGVDECARLWDTATGAELTPPLWHKADVLYACFSPDGQQVATASADGTARVWNASTGGAVTPPLQHRTPVGYAAFSPDGRALVTGGRRTPARVWDARTGEQLTPPLGERLILAFFSPNGEQVIAASANGMLESWPIAFDVRPAAEATLLARLLSGRRIDSTGGLVRPEHSEFTSDMRRLWTDLAARFPASFATPAAQAAGWHEREAAEGAARSSWREAVDHLDDLIALFPGRPRLYLRRAWLSVELEEWGSVAGDFWRAIELGEDGIEVWRARACALLAAGDVDGYRSLCTQLIRRYSETEDPLAAEMVARICNLAPRSVPDYEPVLQLARRGCLTFRARGPSSLGAALYRSGSLRLALVQLHLAVWKRGELGAVRDGYFLAMVWHQLGRAGTARATFEKAKRATEAAKDELSWMKRIELRLLSDEVRALLAGRSG